MVGTLFENEVKLKGVTTLGYQSAHALNDPVRIKILEILTHKQMTTEEISKILRRTGHKKATTTIRHHLDTLKSAGLIEVTKMVQVRGAVRKYYMPTLRAFSYNVPNLEKQSKLIEDTSSRLLKVLKSIFEDKKFATEINGKDTCNLCKGDHYKEYVAFETLNIALARTLQSKEYAIMIGGKKQPKK
ncbi:MAG: winged helix-turn-helix domain-containing protein [Thermoproteota archaeon]|nr:winged helix-turn-helix domain-containing protein [Thermoproteota archaeon]